MNAKEERKFLEAAREGNVKVFERLFAGIDAGRERDLLNRALMQAVFGRSQAITDRLLKAGANPDQMTSTDTLLMCVATRGDLRMARSLVEAGAGVNREVKRETALSAALSENQTRVVDYLEKLGATSPPSTTLLYASIHGDLKRARRAIADGAELERKGGIFEETPLMAAACRGQIEMVRLLLRHGANPNQRVDGSTALFAAVERGARPNIPEVVELLLAAGADIRAKRCDDTLLMAACRGGSLRIVKRLVELGANVQAKDKHHGMTALDYAKRDKHKEIAAYLGGLGAASERDAGLALVRALARDFGGKVIEHSHGFMLNARFHGMKGQFGVQTEGMSLFVQGLNFGERELKRGKDAQLVFTGDKPDIQKQEAREMKGVFRGSSPRVFRTMGLSVLTEPFAVAFCRKHKKLLEALKLSGEERVRIGGTFASFFCPKPDIAVVRQRLEVFARFLQGVSRPPQPERRLFEREWLLKPAPKTVNAVAAAHGLGGKLPQPTACPHCGCATNLMARIDLSDAALPGTALGRRELPVFWCLDCLEWSAAFFDISKEPPRPWSRTIAGRKMPKLAEGENDLPERRLTLVPVTDGRKAGRKSKLGGPPAWIQMDETPDCPKCERTMAFVLQLASDSRISYGDMGILHAFACPECRITATLVQSH